MKKTTRIKKTNLPLKAPFLSIIVAWLLLDRLGAYDWMYGAVGLFVALWLWVWFISQWNDIEVDLFETDKKEVKVKVNSEFQERLNKAMKKAEEAKE